MGSRVGIKVQIITIYVLRTGPLQKWTIEKYFVYKNKYKLDQFLSEAEQL